eukprot:CAMPEP_0118887396 /NCGR_PEP_ID=MMETSP1163-20130328/25124_1 /TAXON_ID=124430 /ORGANISM="Phaeomonas parva, Strain CCMP2877" /LENGTH=35 /DNA_ID= /DNA_START= /DNA_END= /DNA_ORIENTATION=
MGLGEPRPVAHDALRHARAVDLVRAIAGDLERGAH